MNTLLFNLQWVLGERMKPLDIFGAAIWPTIVLLKLLIMRFVYWDTDEQAIHEHRFRAHRIVPFSVISKVTGIADWGPRPGQLKIEYASSGNPSKKGRIYPRPANVDALLDVLRQRLPSACVDL